MAVTHEEIEVWDDVFENLLRARLRGTLGDGELDADLPLAALGMNSLATVALITSLEETYAVTFPEEVLVPVNFRTPRAVWSTLSAVRGTVTHDRPGPRRD